MGNGAGGGDPSFGGLRKRRPRRGAMTPIERLQTALNGLGLKAVEARVESLLEQASKKEPSYADFLDELLSCEVDARRSRYLRARLQLAPTSKDTWYMRSYPLSNHVAWQCDGHPGKTAGSQSSSRLPTVMTW
jgi:hypothetical protein